MSYLADELGDLVMHAEAPQRARHARLHRLVLRVPRTWLG